MRYAGEGRDIMPETSTQRAQVTGAGAIRREPYALCAAAALYEYTTMAKGCGNVPFCLLQCDAERLQVRVDRISYPLRTYTRRFHCAQTAAPAGLKVTFYCTPSRTRSGAVLQLHSTAAAAKSQDCRQKRCRPSTSITVDPTNTSSARATPGQRSVPSALTFSRGGAALLAFFALEDGLPLVVDGFFFVTLLTMAGTALFSRLHYKQFRKGRESSSALQGSK